MWVAPISVSYKVPLPCFAATTHFKYIPKKYICIQTLSPRLDLNVSGHCSINWVYAQTWSMMYLKCIVTARVIHCECTAPDGGSYNIAYCPAIWYLSWLFSIIEKPILILTFGVIWYIHSGDKILRLEWHREITFDMFSLEMKSKIWFSVFM